MVQGLASKTGTPQVLSVGLAAVDFVATVDHFPSPDEKMRSSSLIVEGGGNAANTACAIAGMAPFVGGSTLLTAVGEDANGKTIIDGLEQRNVQVLAEKYPGTSPFSYIINTDIDGDNTRTIVHQPSSGDLTVDYVLDQSLDKYTLAHFDVRYPEAAVELAQKLREMKLPYAVDVERPREGLKEIMEGASIVICNSEYCKNVDEEGDDDTDPMERLIRVMNKQAPNAKIALQTVGGKGSILVCWDKDDNLRALELDGKKLGDHGDKNAPKVTATPGGGLLCPPFGGCKVVDTTGAGDSFIGGFLSAISAVLANGNDGIESISSDPVVLARAMRIGSRVAGKKIAKPGARSGLPLAEDDEFLKAEFSAMLK